MSTVTVTPCHIWTLIAASRVPFCVRYVSHHSTAPYHPVQPYPCVHIPHPLLCTTISCSAGYQMWYPLQRPPVIFRQPYLQPSRWPPHPPTPTLWGGGGGWCWLAQGPPKDSWTVVSYPNRLWMSYWCCCCFLPQVFHHQWWSRRPFAQRATGFLQTAKFTSFHSPPPPVPAPS